MGKPTIPGQEKQGAMNFIEYESRRLGKIYRRAEINGIKFEIGFDNMSYQKYTCYFPEIHSRA